MIFKVIVAKLAENNFDYERWNAFNRDQVNLQINIVFDIILLCDILFWLKINVLFFAITLAKLFNQQRGQDSLNATFMATMIGWICFNFCPCPI